MLVPRPRTFRTPALLAASAALVVAGLAAPSLAGSRPAAGPSGDTTVVSRAAGQRATISVLPQISQPGKGVASPAAARTVVAVKVSPAKEGRPVVLQRLSGTSWVKAGKAKLTQKGLAEFSVATTLGGAPIVYRATALKYSGKAAVTSGQVLSTQWGAPDFVDEFTGSTLGPVWTHRAKTYNAAGLRRCSKGSPKAVDVRRGAVELSVLVDKSKGHKLCTAKRADGSKVGKFKYRLNGHISTEGRASLRYGVAAARMKFQKSRGQHASFWLQPNVMTGSKDAQTGGAEIDVIEWFGHPTRNGGLTSFIYHPSKKGPVKVGDFIDKPDRFLSSKSDAWWKRYHVFSVEWTPQVYIFRIDGKESWRTTAGISGVKQFPILSLLSSDYELDDLGGDKRLPQRMYVDWVQFWETDTPTS